MCPLFSSLLFLLLPLLLLPFPSFSHTALMTWEKQFTPSAVYSAVHFTPHPLQCTVHYTPVYTPTPCSSKPKINKIGTAPCRAVKFKLYTVHHDSAQGSLYTALYNLLNTVYIIKEYSVKCTVCSAQCSVFSV